MQSPSNNAILIVKTDSEKICPNPKRTVRISKVKKPPNMMGKLAATTDPNTINIVIIATGVAMYSALCRSISVCLLVSSRKTCSPPICIVRLGGFINACLNCFRNLSSIVLSL